MEDPAGLEAEVALEEQDVARVRAGQEVALLARALPFETFTTRVERVAPAAGRGDAQGRVTAYCRLTDAPAELRLEMTRHARVYTGRRPVGAILLDRALRFVRTEFWWQRPGPGQHRLRVGGTIAQVPKAILIRGAR